MATKTKVRVPKQKSKVKEEIKTANEKVTLQKVVINRDLKYIYPEDMTDTLERKKFRAKVRNELQKLNAEVGKLRGQARKDAKSKLDEYAAAHLVKA